VLTPLLGAQYGIKEVKGFDVRIWSMRNERFHAAAVFAPPQNVSARRLIILQAEWVLD
jgi:hypothetical protein